MRLTQKQLTTTACITLVVAGIFAWWLSMYLRPPAVAKPDLKYIQLLRTAVSSQNETHLLSVEKALRKRVDAEQIEQPQWRHFQKIIEIAKRGDWDQANQACESFESAQQNR